MGGAAGEMDVDVEVGGTTGDKTRVANVEHEGDMSCDEELLRHPTLTKYDLAVNTRLKRVVCLYHRCVVAKAHLENHIKDQHSAAHEQNRTLLAKLTDVVEELKVQDGFPPMPNCLGPIPLQYEGLRTVTGLLCDSCGHGFVGKKSLRTHLSTHGLKPADHVGKAKTSKLQQFSAGNQGAKVYFPVLTEEHLDLPDELDKFVASALSGFAKCTIRLKEDQRDPRAMEPWLKMNKWLKYVEGHDAAKLRQLVELPKNGKEYFSLVSIVEDLFKEAEGLLEHTAELTRCILNTFEPAKGINHTPMHAFQKEETMTAYSHVPLKLVLLILRTLDVDEGAGANSEWSGYHIPLPHCVRTDAVSLRAAMQSKASRADVMELVHRLLLSLWSRQWLPTKENPFPDPTMRTVMLTQLTDDGGFLTPKDATGVLAKFTAAIVRDTVTGCVCKYWVLTLRTVLTASVYQRLVFLREAHTRAQGEDEVDGDVDHVGDFIKDHQKWFTEGVESTFHNIRATQHFATAQAQSNQSTPRFWWTVDGEEMEYDGKNIKYGNIRNLCHGLQDQMYKLLNELRFDKTNSVKYDRLEDRLRERQAGYSFYTDCSNSEVFSKKDLLLRYIVSDKTLRERFIRSMEGGKKHEWQMTELINWLSKYSKLLLFALVALEFVPGGPARIAELTAMLLQNTCAAERNIILLAMNVCCLRRYNKTTANTGFNKIVPDILDAFTGELFIQIIAVLRPLASLFAGIVWPGNAVVRDNYENMMFTNMDRLFDASDVTFVIRKLTNEYLGSPLTTRDWRHVCIAFKRKRNPEIFKLLENFETVDSAQAGHTRSIDMNIYAVAENLYEGAPEDILPLYVRACHNWQRDLHLIPGGKFAPLEDCRWQNFEHQPKTASHTGATAALASIPDIASGVVQAMQPMMQQWFQSQQNRLDELTAEVKDVKAQLNEALTNARASRTNKEDQISPSRHEMEFKDCAQEVPTHAESAASGCTSTMASDTFGSTLDVDHSEAFSGMTLDADDETLYEQANSTTSGTQPGERMKVALVPRHHAAVNSAGVHAASQAKPSLFSGRETPTKPQAEAVGTVVANEGSLSKSDKALPFSPVEVEERALSILQKLVDPSGKKKATWRNEGQKMAVLSALEFKKDVLVVLATGSGKTFIPSVVAFVEEQSLTILAMPFNAIYDSTVKALCKSELPFQEWDKKKPISSQTRLLLVTCDGAVDKTFEAAIATAKRCFDYHRIRLFIDEVHTPLTEGSYRSRLKFIREIRKERMQFVGMSATVPPTIEHNILAQAGISPRMEGTRVVRTVTDRPEISFHVRPISDCLMSIGKSILKTWFQLEMQGLVKPEDRAIVFVTTGADGRDMQRYLNVEENTFGGRKASFIYSTLASEEKLKALTKEEKRDILTDWENGTSAPMLISTNVLGAGFHSDNTRVVFHVGLAPNVMMQIQQSGRVARDGNVGFAIMHPMSKDRNTKAGPDVRTDQIVFQNQKECLRRAFFYHLDGVGKACDSEAYYAKCNRCVAETEDESPSYTRFLPTLHPSNAPPATLRVDDTRKRSGTESVPFANAAKRAKEQRQSRVGGELAGTDRLRDALQIFSGRCVFCYLRADTSVARHEISSCSSIGYEGRGAFFDWKKPFRYDRNVGVCFHCHLPSLDGLAHPKFGGTVEQCPNRDVVAPVVYCALKDTETFEKMKASFSAKAPGVGPTAWDDSALARWLVSRSSENDRWTNMNEVLVWVAENVKSIVRHR